MLLIASLLTLYEACSAGSRVTWPAWLQWKQCSEKRGTFTPNDVKIYRCVTFTDLDQSRSAFSSWRKENESGFVVFFREVLRTHLPLVRLSLLHVWGINQETVTGKVQPQRGSASVRSSYATRSNRSHPHEHFLCCWKVLIRKHKRMRLRFNGRQRSHWIQKCSKSLSYVSQCKAMFVIVMGCLSLCVL